MSLSSWTLLALLLELWIVAEVSIADPIMLMVEVPVVGVSPDDDELVVTAGFV